ncbi:hypothetical protein MNBD_BACTEROID06-1176 [hydrothermal vent metagenome]|uniref:Uncharacterized protein n=1 Tax=hydrothermal vent metagenome TaxID=652676 RepID=A0A3B0UI57_9ZZZZ
MENFMAVIYRGLFYYEPGLDIFYPLRKRLMDFDQNMLSKGVFGSKNSCKELHTSCSI